MSGVFSDILTSLKKVNTKTKKYVDVLYLFALVLFLSTSACSFTSHVVAFVPLIQTISAVLLIIVGLLRLLTEFAINYKRALLALPVLLFGILYSMNSQEVIPMSTVAFAIIGGIGVQANLIVGAGVIGTVLLIIYNIVMSFFADATIIMNVYQYRDFFYLGENQFLMSKMNNSSSTGMAAHYLWMIAGYLWIRGKKITWGEIVALFALNFFIYSLTGSNTTFLCIVMLLLFASVMKLWVFADKRFSLRNKIDSCNGKAVIFKTICNFFVKTFEFLTKFSFVILALFCITCTVLYNANNPILSKLNNILHYRLSLGHRGIVEHGVHFIASGVPNYGEASSADGFYNFFDCSFVSILIVSGILPLVFYLLSITIIQLKNRKYIYGAALLAVCAISCIEEHHLAEIYDDFFILLLFADFNVDMKLNPKVELNGSRNSKIVNGLSFALAVLFVGGAAYTVIPKFKASKELDRLDQKAELIYCSVQNALDSMSSDGTWNTSVAKLSTEQCGYPMEFPTDYYDAFGEFWYEAIAEPNRHAYYYIMFDPSNEDENAFNVTDLLINDETKLLIGDGSVVIEYDLVAGDVYAVWYSEESNCAPIKDGRNSYRSGRLLDCVKPEGYYVGFEYD